MGGFGLGDGAEGGDAGGVQAEAEEVAGGEFAEAFCVEGGFEVFEG